MAKIERLAGIPGKPEVGLGWHEDWFVVQYDVELSKEKVYGPACKDEQAAIRAWNSMVGRIRKANAGASKWPT